VIGFVGFLNRLGFVGKVSGLAKSGFQDQVNFFGKSFGQVFLQRFWLVVLVLAKE
jgi:hypothetical protein